MPRARYKVKSAICKKTFDNDNKGASLQEVPSKLHTEDSIMVQEKLNSFHIFIIAVHRKPMQTGREESQCMSRLCCCKPLPV